MKAKMIAAGVVGGVLLILLIQNTQVVSVRFLFWQLSMSRIILLPAVMFLGFAIGFFFGKKPWKQRGC